MMSGRTDLLKNIKKYYRYVFDTRGLQTGAELPCPSANALRAAAWMRGEKRGSAIVIHGIMKRSGTVYTQQILGLHEDLHPSPNHIWEIPFLPLTGDLNKLQERFLLGYEQNRDKVVDGDFLPVFGSAFIGYLHSWVPEGKRMVVKMPGVEYLDHFFTVFPYEHLLVVTRDGRDLVASTIKKWPQLRFSHVCQRWARSARMILDCDRHFEGREGYWRTRYEDILKDPRSFAFLACQVFDLNVDRFRMSDIDGLPVIGSSFSGDEWIEKPQDFSTQNRWDGWTEGQKRTFKRIAGSELMALGYCDNLDW